MIFHTEGECYLLAMCSVKSATSLKVKGVVTQAGMEKCLSYSAHVQQWTLCFAAFPTCSTVVSPVQAQGKRLFCLSLSVEMRKNREAQLEPILYRPLKHQLASLHFSINHNHDMRGSVQFGTRERQMFSLLCFSF